MEKVLYLVTIVNDNLDEKHYLADSVEEGEKFLLKEYFDGDTEYMEKCKNELYFDDVNQVWNDEEADYTLMIEPITKINKDTKYV